MDITSARWGVSRFLRSVIGRTGNTEDVTHERHRGFARVSREAHRRDRAG
jgi:hypothetical protein